jgi:hypothetical protein
MILPTARLWAASMHKIPQNALQPAPPWESTRCRTSSERTDANSSPSLYEKHPSFLVYVSHRMVTFSVKDYVQTEIDSVSFMTKIIL